MRTTEISFGLREYSKESEKNCYKAFTIQREMMCDIAEMLIDEDKPLAKKIVRGLVWLLTRFYTRNLKKNDDGTWVVTYKLYV